MSIEIKQFAESTVSPVDDARLYDFLSGKRNGIIQGCEIVHLGVNQLKVTAGWGICCGRMFTVEEETVNAALATSGKMKGVVYIGFDMSAEIPAGIESKVSAQEPSLIQENINGSGTVYQLPLCRYETDELKIISVTETPKLKNLSEDYAKKEDLQDITGGIKIRKTTRAEHENMSLEEKKNTFFIIEG